LLEAESQAHQVLAEAERTRQAIAQDVRLLTCQKRQLMDGLSNLLSQHLGLLHVQQGQDERRRGNDIPVLAVTTSAAPQTGNDMGHTAAFTNDLAQPGTEEKAQRRGAASLVEDFQR
jgi:hypothetical protein